MFVGTSGWRYASWRGDFYPKGLVQRRELEYLASRLGSVELNGSFYSLQKPESYDRWREQTPPGFRFAVKGSRYITHMVGAGSRAGAKADSPDNTDNTDNKTKRDAAIERFFASGVTRLGDRLGPILWQLPARQPFEKERLDAFCSALPRRRDGHLLVYALEPRYPSFADPAARDVLTRHGIALVVSDGAGSWPVFTEATGGVVYLRLHGPDELYHGGYGPKQLTHWAGTARHLATADGRENRPRDVYIYFDNDADGCAPHDALAMADTLTK